MAVWAHWLVCCQCGWELRMEEVYGRPLPEYPRACPECGADSEDEDLVHLLELSRDDDSGSNGKSRPRGEESDKKGVVFTWLEAFRSSGSHPFQKWVLRTSRNRWWRR